MANYTGVLVSFLESFKRRGYFLYSEWEKIYSRWYISSEKYHAGSYSLCLFPGGIYDIDYGCDAGSKAIEVWVWPPTDHKIRIQVIDPVGHTEVASAAPAGSGAWEKVTINFTAQKKVYVLRLVNATVMYGDKRAWFDDIV